MASQTVVSDETLKEYFKDVDSKNELSDRIPKSSSWDKIFLIESLSVAKGCHRFLDAVYFCVEKFNNNKFINEEEREKVIEVLTEVYIIIQTDN
jgi:hypothetical protein